MSRAEFASLDQDRHGLILRGDRAAAVLGEVLGLQHAQARGGWPVTDLVRAHLLWPLAEPAVDRALAAKFEGRRAKPSQLPTGPVLSHVREAFVFLGPPRLNQLAKDALFHWSPELLGGVWTAPRSAWFKARLLWALADEATDLLLADRFGAASRPDRPMAAPALMIDENEGRYVCLVAAKDGKIPAREGFRFDPADKIWSTMRADQAMALDQWAEPRLRRAYDRFLLDGIQPRQLKACALRDLLEVADRRLTPGAALIRETGRERLIEAARGRFFTTNRRLAETLGLAYDEDQQVWHLSLEQALARRTQLSDRAAMLAQEQLVERLPDGLAPGMPAAPPGQTWKGFQLDGIRFLAARQGAILADEMGTGKSCQALGALRLLAVDRALIACPAFLIPNWQDEILRWWPDMPVQAWRPGQEVLAHGLVLVSYDVLHRAGPLASQDWPVMVCDEAHLLKNPETRRACGIMAGTHATRNGTFPGPWP